MPQNDSKKKKKPGVASREKNAKAFAKNLQESSGLSSFRRGIENLFGRPKAEQAALPKPKKRRR